VTHYERKIIEYVSLSLILFLIFIFISGCSIWDQAVKNVENRHLDYVKILPELEWSNIQWTELVVNEIAEKPFLSVTPNDATEFCPNFSKLTKDEKIEFYAHLISQVAKYESNFDTDATYRENFSDRSGESIISRGLLQLSIESALGYKCPLANARELHDPIKNLSCGVTIFDRWITKDKYISEKINGKWLGLARYWSVMRDTNPRRTLEKIVSYMRELDICK